MNRLVFHTALLMSLLFALLLSEAAAEGFPVTIRHRMGESVVQTAPRRIVSIGLNDQDFLYSLDIAPVAVRQWWQNRPFATGPWAEPARERLGARPAVMAGRNVDPEWVLSLEPDLIVATYGDLDRVIYERLSRIAPVITGPAGYVPFTAPWEEQLRLLDLATSGNTKKADDVIQSIERTIAALRAAHPEFQGRTASFADARDGQFLLWSGRTSTGRFLARLGLAMPERLTSLADSAGWIHLSFEEAGLMDLDVVLWPNAARSDIEAMRVYRNLCLFRHDRSVWLATQPDLAAALWFQSPLSLEFALERIAPLLAGGLRSSDNPEQACMNVDG